MNYENPTNHAVMQSLELGGTIINVKFWILNDDFFRNYELLIKSQELWMMKD